MHLRGHGPILNTLTPWTSPTQPLSPSIIANSNLHLSLQLVYFCPATCFSLARHASGIPPHLLAEAAALLPWLKPCWQKYSSQWFLKGLLLHSAGIKIN